MPVAVPVRSLHMDLDIPDPRLAIYSDLRIKEIRSRIPVQHARVNHPHPLSALQKERYPKHPISPKQLKYLLHNLKTIGDSEIDSRIYRNGFHQIHVSADFAAEVDEVVEHGAVVGLDFRYSSPELHSGIE